MASTSQEIESRSLIGGISDGSLAMSSKSNELNDTSSDAKDAYKLMRDCAASTRLTAQHYLWRELLGFLSHPDINISDPNLKVADVATGNGIWLHDFCRIVPSSAELHGFDISLDQVGTSFWLPENMHMHSWNLFQPPDAKFIGYFDVVHVRLITLVVDNDDPRPLLENLTKLLKPGGYLQWDEVDTVNCYIKTVPGVLGSNLEELFSQIRGHDTWKKHLVKLMAEHGYDNPQRYSYQYEDSISRVWTDEYVAT